ncbi:MAG: adenylate/guanylate cyclase domain-containing protein [Rhodobacteraceae bacterium]|nr:adenylate/guanylate cyclase domain-containing protein [Paracoccaceae bacterium]
MERKLSTIFALDVVGFSKLMAADEDITLAVLKQRREIIDQVIIEQNGRMFGSAGDSVIAEFDSPVKATEASITIQSKMQLINEALPEHQKMRFRIGLNLGDVMISGDNLYGDAINVAARLEAKAEPDGICISKTVFDMVSQKVKASFESVGELELKNIEIPVEAFFVLQFKGAGRYHQHNDAPQIQIEKAEAGSLAVMMFKSLSTDEEQAYFCEGFSEDLISSLSQFRKLFVVSGSASFAYRDKDKKPKEIGKELGVRYILEGSVRKMGPRMRISTSLISAEKESTVWSSNYDTTIDEIFDIQDELIATIISTIVGRVDADQVQQLVSSRPENLAAYDLVLQGLEHHRKAGATRDNAEKAYSLFKQATELDPNYARAHAWRACSLANYQSWDKEAAGSNWMEECSESVSRALEIDPEEAEAHRIMGSIKMISGDFQSGRYHHEKAKDLCPSDAYIAAKYATALIYMGEPEQALEEIKRAMRLDPFCPDVLFEDEGIVNFCMNDFENAIKSFSKLKSATKNSLFYSAASYSKLNDKEKATELLAQALNLSGETVDQYLKGQQYEKPEPKQHLVDALNMIS